jgi:hypothetical protein
MSHKTCYLFDGCKRYVVQADAPAGHMVEICREEDWINREEMAEGYFERECLMRAIVHEDTAAGRVVALEEDRAPSEADRRVAGLGLDVDLGLVDASGRASRFPMVCNHCGRTYWYTPDQRTTDFESFRPAIMDVHCQAWFLRELADALANGVQVTNQGSAWWKALHREGKEAGIRQAEHEGGDPD